MPRQSLLSDPTYLDQFCFSVSCAVVSSARQASLLRPSTMAPRPAASQLGPTWSVGGPPARTRAICAPYTAAPTKQRAATTHEVLMRRMPCSSLFNRPSVRASSRGLLNDPILSRGFVGLVAADDAARGSAE